MNKNLNIILLEKLKDKYPDINISKPVYPEGYWNETFKILRDTENDIKKEIK